MGSAAKPLRKWLKQTSRRNSTPSAGAAGSCWRRWQRLFQSPVRELCKAFPHSSGEDRSQSLQNESLSS
jgi:hypothetical protein